MDQTAPLIILYLKKREIFLSSSKEDIGKEVQPL